MDWKHLSAMTLATITLVGCVAPMPEQSSTTEPAPTVSTEPILIPTSTPSLASEPAAAVVEEAAILPEPTAEEAPPASEQPALTAEQQTVLDGLRNQGVAPELTNETWINSEPLQLTDLRGNVVIVEFWTYG